MSRIFSSSLSNFFFFPLESSLLDFPFLEFLLHPSDSVYLSRSPLLLPLLLLLLLLPDWNFHRSKRLRGPRRPFAGELTVPRTCVFQLLRAPSLGEGANEAWQGSERVSSAAESTQSRSSLLDRSDHYEAGETRACIKVKKGDACFVPPWSRGFRERSVLFELSFERAVECFPICYYPLGVICLTSYVWMTPGRMIYPWNNF